MLCSFADGRGVSRVQRSALAFYRTNRRSPANPAANGETPCAALVRATAHRRGSACPAREPRCRWCCLPGGSRELRRVARANRGLNPYAGVVATSTGSYPDERRSTRCPAIAEHAAEGSSPNRLRVRQPTRDPLCPLQTIHRRLPLRVASAARSRARVFAAASIEARAIASCAA